MPRKPRPENLGCRFGIAGRRSRLAGSWGHHVSVTGFRAGSYRGVTALALALAAVLAAALPASGQAADWERAVGVSEPRGPIDYEPTNRIVGGSFTTAERFPWQAAIVF